jgi:hypothetical protein
MLRRTRARASASTQPLIGAPIRIMLTATKPAKDRA